MINVLSGQFADAGIQMENGARTYIKQHGDTLAGKKSRSSAATSAAPCPTSPSATRRSWWCATRSISSPDSC